MEPQIQQEPTVRATKSSISTGAAIITGAVIIALALILVLSPKQAETMDPGATPPAEITEVSKEVATIRPNDRVRGDVATAEIAVIEYSDSDCPFCSRFHATMLEVMDEYKGKVAWVYRYLPLTSLHPNAVTEAVALECVATLGGNNAFNTYLDKVIDVTLTPDAKSNQTLTDFATAAGINGDAFKTCMAGTVASDRVSADTAEANSIGIRGTPFSIIVNLKTGEQKIVPGAYPIEDMRTFINDILK